MRLKAGDELRRETDDILSTDGVMCYTYFYPQGFTNIYVSSKFTPEEIETLTHGFTNFVEMSDVQSGTSWAVNMQKGGFVSVYNREEAKLIYKS
jgi:hypothetical protein